MLCGGSAPLALRRRSCVHATCMFRTFSFAARDAPPPACFWVSLLPVPHASLVVFS